MFKPVAIGRSYVEEAAPESSSRVQIVSRPPDPNFVQSRRFSGCHMVLNRTQLLVIGFFVLVWIALVAILILAPQVYMTTLRQAGAGDRAIEASFVIAVSALIALLVIGVVRR